MSSLKETAMRWLSKPNNGSTDAYEQHYNQSQVAQIEALAEEYENRARYVRTVPAGSPVQIVRAERYEFARKLRKLAAHLKPAPPADFDEYHGGAE